MNTKGHCYPKSIILYAVYFKLRFTLSYRDVEEIMKIRGVQVDHATIQRWVCKFSPFIVVQMKKRKLRVSSSWRMDETYIKVKGQWCYLYRAVDKLGNTVDFLLTKRRQRMSAQSFLIKAINNNYKPRVIIIDKSGSTTGAIRVYNKRSFSKRKIRAIDASYNIVYAELLDLESTVLNSSIIESDKKTLLVTLSIERYVIYNKRKRKRKDRDWELSVGNFLIMASSTNSSNALLNGVAGEFID